MSIATPSSAALPRDAQFAGLKGGAGSASSASASAVVDEQRHQLHRRIEVLRQAGALPDAAESPSLVAWSNWSNG